MDKTIVFFDTEISPADHKIKDIGALKEGQPSFHNASVSLFGRYINGTRFLCGHNIFRHDLKYLNRALSRDLNPYAVDTLYLSPLLFPRRPYHSLLKDDKLQTEELNNPLNDSMKAQKLFYDEAAAFDFLPEEFKQIYTALLYPFEEFKSFFDYMGTRPSSKPVVPLIRKVMKGRICENANLEPLVRTVPRELAYALSLISTDDPFSITPAWLTRNFPRIEDVVRILCGTPCEQGCPYCRGRIDPYKGLKEFFGFDGFRSYGGEPLQEKAVRAAVKGKSLLAVFPTGGGKSLTFQLPALMAAKNVHGLTVVISPLQSLMKDQVDHLNEAGINSAVTVNGLLDPVERANALERIASGSASLLYISPEQLRSVTIENLLLSRHVVRFVIDEAHCFSAWGQDFRVDYLYIGDFIGELQKKKKSRIPVSCFTATAKPKVITDIRDYFKRKLGIDLEMFTTSAARENLHYTVLYRQSDDQKYTALRDLLSGKECPSIVYVSRTARCERLAQKLVSDGFRALAFHGKMDKNEKVKNQDAFLRDEARIIVATSAFGMGVDKKDVGLVIHYDISDSLENYIQEAGRAGRDPGLKADCYVLYNDQDLDRHFLLLNQTRLTVHEIQQVWKAVKELTAGRNYACCSALEIARRAGFDDSVTDIETRVRTALSALENAGYITRGKNMPKVYATGILVKNMQEAAEKIDRSSLFAQEQKEKAKRIIRSLISSRSIARAGNDEAESRVDYLADMLGLTREEVIDTVNLMRQDGLLADSMDMSAYLSSSESENRAEGILERFASLENFLLEQLTENGAEYSFKELNQKAQEAGIQNATVKNLRILLYYLSIRNDIYKKEDRASGRIFAGSNLETSRLKDKYYRRIELCRFITAYLYGNACSPDPVTGQRTVQFSLTGLYQAYLEQPRMIIDREKLSLADVRDALLYLSAIGALKLEGGFLVLYNGLQIKRLVMDNRVRYKNEDYRLLDEFYKQKIRQIHIVGEYANLMVRDYKAALDFVHDYFTMDFRKFISRYFNGKRSKEISRTITPKKYEVLFSSLSNTQAKIIQDDKSRCIVIAAGPGSGKTRVLVHKLASLLLMEEVKSEELLMLTFSRAAATEFKKRLRALIGAAADFVQIKTFHSYCFDLLGKVGSLEDAENIIPAAVKLIKSAEADPRSITKKVLVIDEAQDMDENDYALITALMDRNEDMRVIAAGDDDQNIFEFRGSDSRYMAALINECDAVKYEMTDNYRSAGNIIALANSYARGISERLKKTEVRAVRRNTGKTAVIHYESKEIYEAVVKHIAGVYKEGSACVLTSTNDEALQVLGLLKQKGIRARLIQSSEGFRLYDLAEVRFLLKQLDDGKDEPVIGDSLWMKAKERLKAVYQRSSVLVNILNLMRDFETLNKVKYRSDFLEFIMESNIEDFDTDERGTILVSTIHKSKGREFDTVWMMLRDLKVMNDPEKRRIYVGMTRAKNALYIHTDSDLFEKEKVSGIKYLYDRNQYPSPGLLMVHLTHRDVVLSYFHYRKELVLSLRCGDPLMVKEGYLWTEKDDRQLPVARFSKAFHETIARYAQMGYEPSEASASFIVAWKKEDAEEEDAVLLADLVFRRL